jgi:hypothetical protein
MTPDEVAQLKQQVASGTACRAAAAAGLVGPLTLWDAAEPDAAWVAWETNVMPAVVGRVGAYCEIEHKGRNYVGSYSRAKYSGSLLSCSISSLAVVGFRLMMAV